MRQRFDHDGSQNRKHSNEDNKYFILNRLARANPDNPDNARVGARLGRQQQKKKKRKKESWASKGVRRTPRTLPPTGLKIPWLTLNSLFTFQRRRFSLNHKSYNSLDCDWFKNLLFSTNSPAKLVSVDSLLSSNSVCNHSRDKQI